MVFEVGRCLGVVNSCLCVLGIYYGARNLGGARDVTFALQPLVMTAVAAVLLVVNTFLVALLAFTSIQLAKAHPDAVRNYSWLAAAQILYLVITTALWFAPEPWGSSVIEATAAVNPFTMPFSHLLVVPGLYPLLSALAVHALAHGSSSAMRRESAD